MQLYFRTFTAKNDKDCRYDESDVAQERRQERSDQSRGTLGAGRCHTRGGGGESGEAHPRDISSDEPAPSARRTGGDAMAGRRAAAQNMFRRRLQDAEGRVANAGLQRPHGAGGE